MARRLWKIVLAATFAPLVGCAAPEVASTPINVHRQKAADPQVARLPSLAQHSEIAAGPGPSTVRQVAHFAEGQAKPAPEAAETFFTSDGPVTAETLVEFARANNPEIAAARFHARALGARVPQVSSLDDPALMTTVFTESIETAAGPQDVVMSLQQKVPWFGKLALRSQVAYHDAMAAYARVAAVELRVAEQVKRAYYDLYFLNSAIEVNNELRPRIEDVIGIARDNYENSIEGIGLESVYQAEIELVKLDTTLAELDQARRKAQARLAEALSLPPGTQFEIERELLRTNVPRTAGVLVDLVDFCQPELRARRREVRRDRAGIALSEKQYYPDATFGINWHEIGSTGLSRVATGEDALAATVGLNIPLYRVRLDAAVREAQYRTAQATRALTASWDESRAEVEVLHAEVIQQQQWLEALEGKIVGLSQQTLDLSMEGYRLGRLEFQQLIENYRDLLNFRIDRYRRQSLREQAIASLERAVGCVVSTWPLEAQGIETVTPPPALPMPPRPSPR